jgi:nicotinic acid phosphoribosyltransferase
MQYSSYGNDLYQSNLMQTYSNYYMNGQSSYQYGCSDQFNSSVTSSNTSLDNSLNTSGGFSAISDNNETILFL